MQEDGVRWCYLIPNHILDSIIENPRMLKWPKNTWMCMTITDDPTFTAADGSVSVLAGILSDICLCIDAHWSAGTMLREQAYP